MNIKKLKEMRGYIASCDWKRRGSLDMRKFWGKEDDDYLKRNCGCLLGLSKKEGILSSDWCWRLFTKELDLNEVTMDFLFNDNWADYDNTPEGAISRFDAVIHGYWQGGEDGN